MAHQLLLHANRSTNSVQPRPVRVPERMRAEVTNARPCRRFLECLPNPRVGDGQSPDFDGAGKVPVRRTPVVAFVGFRNPEGVTELQKEAASA